MSARAAGARRRSHARVSSFASVGGGHADREAGAQHFSVRRTTVAGGDRTAIGLHDLTADREAKPPMLAEMFGRSLRVEAFEDRFEILLGDARPFVVDGDDEGAATRLTSQLDDDPRVGR